MKPQRRPHDAFLPTLVVIASMWLSGCGGLTPLSEATDETDTGRSASNGGTDSDGETDADGGSDADGGTDTDAGTDTDGGGSNSSSGNPGGGSNSGGGNPGGGSNSGGGGGNRPEPVVFTWSLPPDPDSPTVNDDFPYDALFRGDCDSAAAAITRTPDYVPNYSAWTSPRAIVFTAAGVAFCRGDPATGQALAQQGINQYGIEGLGPEDTPWCKLYRELRSVMEQRPENAFECRGNTAFDGPQFKTGIDANGEMVWDDPLTPEDETLQPSTPQPTPTSGSAEPVVPETPVPETTVPEPPASTSEVPGTPSRGDLGEEQRGE